MSELKKIVPPTPARIIDSCGPLTCQHWDVRRDNGLPFCWRAQRSIAPADMADSFPAWCPLDVLK